MKKILLLFIFFPVLFSCKKQITPASSQEAQAIIIVNGVLHYDNFPDGWGLYYETENNGHLILKNTFPNTDLQYEHYKSLINLPTQLSYKASGDTGCLYGIGPVCGVQIVDVVSLK